MTTSLLNLTSLHLTSFHSKHFLVWSKGQPAILTAHTNAAVPLTAVFTGVTVSYELTTLRIE